ncbi:MAG: acyltransferase domain-containing protein [Defluviitaleaceae bacterium]|nr:acyltransferase domain-containing protein [Defluviitaleaceae bacterium]
MINKGFYEKLAGNIGIPRQTTEIILSLYDTFGDLAEQQEELFSAGHNIKLTEARLKEMAEAAGVNPYTLNFYLLFISAKRLCGIYERQGISEEMFITAMNDLTCKLRECKEEHGVYGTFVFDWFPGWYRMTRFALGRLQYDVMDYRWDKYEKNSYIVSEGDRIYNCHIPSAGPLTRELCFNSYVRASAFFNAKPLVVICSSWLLYPPQREFLPPGSRVLSFMDDFDVISSSDSKGFPDAWRVFGKEHKKMPGEWPRDTSLRRAYADRIVSGKPVGEGKGILIFDNGKIVNK